MTAAAAAPARVDVLQWIGDERLMYGAETESRVKCQAVYDAVRELIEAAKAFPEEPNPYTYRIAHAKLRAALAQVSP